MRVVLICLFFTFSFFSISAQAPVNDDCSGAINIVPATGASCPSTTVANKAGATQSMPGCFGSAEDDVWFKFTATSTRHKISVSNSNPVIELFKGNCSALTSLGCYSNKGSSTSADADFLNFVPGETYYFRIYGSGPTNDQTDIYICVSTPPLPPSNDECSGAILIPVNADNDGTFGYSGEVGYATESRPSCVDARYAAGDVWFKFVASATTQKILVAPRTVSGDNAFQVFSGPCANLTSIACVNTGSYGELDTTTLRNLITGNTYYMRVYDYHGPARPDQNFKIRITGTGSTQFPGTGTGLQAVYYNNETLSGPPLLTRIDPAINFELTNAHPPLSPAPGIVPEDHYSVRWTGKLQSLNSDDYVFTTESDDGIRVWINGILVINNWTSQGFSQKTGGIRLIAGEMNDIVVEYFEGTGDAIAKLYWEHYNTTKQIIPKSQLFPANPAILLPVCTTNISPVNAAIVPGAATATLTWNAVGNADSYDVYLWKGPTLPPTAIANVTALQYAAMDLTPSTKYNWYVVPGNVAGSATACSSNQTSFTTTASPLPSGTGLQAVYYNGINLSGTPLLNRVDTTINFELTYAHQPLTPAPGIVPEDLYSVRWTGKIQPQYSETYTFYTMADDGIRLWVNGIKLVDNWTNQGATEKSGTIQLVAGQQYDIVIEYYEGTGEAVAKLFWSSPGTPKQIVPKSQLFPATPVPPVRPSCAVNISPTNAAFIPSATTATLKWNAAANATSYDIYLWKGSVIPATPIATTTALSYEIAGLTPLTAYN